MRFLFPAAAATALVLACAPQEQLVERIPPLRFAYPQDDVLRVNHIQMKGTHNSYHKRKTADPIPDWDYELPPLDVQLESQGVRQFELDVHYVSEEKRFSVFHVPGADDASTCPWFKDCLAAMKKWSDANRGHHPVIVLIEPKDEIDSVSDRIAGHYEELDAEILAVLGRDRVITPDDVQGDAPTLREAIVTKGWPTLGESRGKFIFGFLDSDHSQDGHLYGYTRGLKDLKGRVMFVNAAPDEPFAGLILMDDPVADAAAIEAAAKQNFIIRTRADSDIRYIGVEAGMPRVNAARDGYGHALSTDHPILLDDFPEYFLDLTGGTPSRCHKVAPKSCKSEDIESKARLQPF